MTRVRCNTKRRLTRFPGEVLLIIASAASCNALSGLSSITPSPHQALSLPTVKNMRPVGPSRILYRSATLDNLSRDDADSILSGAAFGEYDSSPSAVARDRTRRPLAAVVDLRNRDEISKGESVRSDGAKYFYSQLTATSSNTIFADEEDDSNATGPRLINIPILNDVNAFWDEAIERMDSGERIAATLRTAFQGGALDRAAARNLEREGPAGLYTVMMATASGPIGLALRTCVMESRRGPVLFHCQKGKDRTGVLAMLLQSSMGQTDAEIVDAYGASGKLLGGEDSPSSSSSNLGDEAASYSNSNGSNAGGMIDWSHFRGSPQGAMIDTLKWVRDQYGSIGGYLDEASFGEEQRFALRMKNE